MINPIDEHLSNKIANMGFLCALLVVVIHLSGDTVSKTMYLLLGMTTEGGCRIAVPFFFTTAGFLLAGRTDEVGWWGQQVPEEPKRLKAHTKRTRQTCPAEALFDIIPNYV